VVSLNLGRLERRDRVDDFLRGHNGAGIVRQVDVESCVHHLIRVICRRVSHHRDVVAQLSGIANSRFDAGMCNQAYDDELMDSMLLELEIQIGVGEAAGAPMLLDDDFAFGVNSARNSPPQVPYSKVFRAQAAF
jgi:hypothetical protein